MRATPVVLTLCLACGPGSSRQTAGTTAPATTDDGYLWPCTQIRTGADCNTLGQKYIDAMQQATKCSAGDSCAARRPVGGYGPSEVIVCNCTVAVNAARTTAVDQALAAFEAQGCGVGCCPCPAGLPSGYAPACVDGVCR